MSLALKLWNKRDLFKRDPGSNYRKRSQLFLFLRNLILPTKTHSSSSQEGVNRDPRFWKTAGTLRTEKLSELERYPEKDWKPT